MSYLIDFILHIDKHVIDIVTQFGNLTYLILFTIIFIETGAVILPFLPGDSLLFAAGAISANPAYGLNPWLFAFLFWLAALTGDSLNYFIGKHIGQTMMDHHITGRFIKREAIEKSEAFFAKYGALAIIFARYLPIIRTFAPFVAANSGVKYNLFIRYSLIGATTWTIIATGAGYFFGNIPFVQKHFTVVILGIIGVTLLPVIIAAIRAKITNK